MISAVVLTKNEEKNIKPCLASLSWCDEIIVIDDNSTDRTIEIVKKTKAKIFVRSLDNNFSQQRNYGLQKASGDWVLFVDADEKVPSALWYEIMQHTNNTFDSFSGYYLKRTDFIWGKKLEHGETGNVKFLRLAKKDAGLWVGAVHEVWKVSGNTSVLNNFLLHYPHAGVENFLTEINYYTDIRAKELFEGNTKVSALTIFLYPAGKFIMNYFIKLGILDLVPGLVFALMMSLHSFLTRGKLWMLYQKKEVKK